MRDPRLPLRGHAPDPDDLDLGVTPSEAQLTALMHAFYTRVREDAMLGPIFDDAIEDWPHHLEKLAAFWSRATRGTTRYHGNPMIAHHRHLARITPAHFERWLALWSVVTNEELPPQVARHLQDKAKRMSEGLQAGLYGRRPPSA